MSTIQHNKDVSYIEAHFGMSGLSFIPASDSAPYGWGDGDPKDPNWVEPLGIPGNPYKQSVLRSSDGVNYTLTRRVKTIKFDPRNKAGRVTYEDGSTIIVACFPGIANDPVNRSEIYTRGRKVGQSPAGSTISDMVVYRDDSGVDWLWAVCIGSSSYRNTIYSYRIKWTGGILPDEDWELLGQLSSSTYGTSGVDSTGQTVQINRCFNNVSINKSKTAFCVFMFPWHPSGSLNAATWDLLAGCSAKWSGYLVCNRDISSVGQFWNQPVTPPNGNVTVINWSKDGSNGTEISMTSPCTGTEVVVGITGVYDSRRYSDPGGSRNSGSLVFDVYYDEDTLKFCTISYVTNNSHSYSYDYASNRSYWFAGRTLEGVSSQTTTEYGTYNRTSTLAISFGFGPVFEAPLSIVQTLNADRKDNGSISIEECGAGNNNSTLSTSYSFSAASNLSSVDFVFHYYDLKNKVLFFSKSEAVQSSTWSKSDYNSLADRSESYLYKARSYLQHKQIVIPVCDEKKIEWTSTENSSFIEKNAFFNVGVWGQVREWIGNFGYQLVDSGTIVLTSAIYSGHAAVSSSYDRGYPKFGLVPENQYKSTFQYHYPRNTFLNYDFYKGQFCYSIAYHTDVWGSIEVATTTPLKWVFSFGGIPDMVSFVGVVGKRPSFDDIGRV